MKFKDVLNKRYIFWDGATGTILQQKGLPIGAAPELWNLDHAEDVISLNQSYYEAGSDVVNANTFGACRLRFPDNLEDIIVKGVAHARAARKRAGREEDGFVALDIGPSGKLLAPMGDLPFEEAVSLFGETARIGEAAGADVALIETMTDSYELKAAVLGVKENSKLPVCATVVFDEKGKMLTGGTVESVVALLEGLRVDALGVNCALGPEALLPIVKKMCAVTSLPVIVNPNAGLPVVRDGVTAYDVDPDSFAKTMKEMASLGVQVLGGCCGTTPVHISRMKEACKSVPFQPATAKNRSVIASFSRAEEIGKKPLLIGERINPTGKSKFKAALKENNIDYILGEGIAQEEKGCHILDVNVGLPGIDEPQMMETVVTRLQAITALPLQIDTSNIQAMERGLRAYNGKALINSVNGKQEVMDAVFPLVQKYGGVVVALALDDNGIPETAQGRIDVAKKIYAEAEKYGIKKEDIVVDTLTMTVSSDNHAALVTLDCLRRVRDELSGNTVLGVSNVSFGLPKREIVNTAFFTLALQNGLSLAIMNPLSEPMMQAYYAYLALSGLDAQCGEYIRVYGEQAGGTAPAGQTGNQAADMPLAECVERGMAERAEEACKRELQNTKPMEIVNEVLIPALDRVGKGFEKGSIFLPQLLMSAEAAKAAFEVIKMAMKDEPKQMRGKIILATVKGDIHDIGKNIVKVLLENYGFQVYDLGRDVPPELILETVVREDVKLVGLSALMTTTVVNMEKTIKLLRKEKPDTKIVVGGAVLTEEYAMSIGADRYARDAMATVHYAEEVLG